jgi:hypothetical protein
VAINAPKLVMTNEIIYGIETCSVYRVNILVAFKIVIESPCMKKYMAAVFCKWSIA